MEILNKAVREIVAKHPVGLILTFTAAASVIAYIPVVNYQELHLLERKLNRVESDRDKMFDNVEKLFDNETKLLQRQSKLENGQANLEAHQKSIIEMLQKK